MTVTFQRNPLLSLLFTICALVWAKSSAETNCLNPDSSLPEGSYKHEYNLRKSEGLAVLELEKSQTDEGVDLYYGDSSLKDVCKYVNSDFDIQLTGDLLILKPGRRVTAKQFIRSLELDSAEHEGTWYTLGSWIPFNNWPHAALNHASDLPDSCDLNRTYVVRDIGLLETECDTNSKRKAKTLIPALEVCDTNQGLVNYNGQLICRNTFSALIQYYTGLGLLLGDRISELPAERAACDAAGGGYRFIATSPFPMQINGGIYFRNSGFYICESNESLEMQKHTPSKQTFVGYDIFIGTTLRSKRPSA